MHKWRVFRRVQFYSLCGNGATCNKVTGGCLISGGCIRSHNLCECFAALTEGRGIWVKLFSQSCMRCSHLQWNLHFTIPRLWSEQIGSGSRLSLKCLRFSKKPILLCSFSQGSGGVQGSILSQIHIKCADLPRNIRLTDSPS